LFLPVAGLFSAQNPFVGRGVGAWGVVVCISVSIFLGRGFGCRDVACNVSTPWQFALLLFLPLYLVYGEGGLHRL